MKKLFIFLITIAVGFWGIYAYKIQQKKQKVEQTQTEQLQKEEEIRQKKEKEREIVTREREYKRKLKNLSDDMSKRITLELMQKLCPNSGKRSDYKLLKYSFNEDTKTLIVDTYSEWIGKNYLLDDDKLHKVETRITIFGNDHKTFIEIRDENEVFKISKQNSDIQALAQQTLSIGLDILNQIHL